MKKISRYRHLVGDAVIGEIFHKAKKLYHKKIININSTYMGGGVAEILTNLIPLFNSIGLNVDWRILHGTNELYEITKKFHNALQGDTFLLSDIHKE